MIDKTKQMTWSQFSIKILGVYFGNSVIDNSNWDKISHSLTKNQHYALWTQCNSLWDENRNCKPNPIIQTLVYRSNIHNFKIYQKENWKKKTKNKQGFSGTKKM